MQTVTPWTAPEPVQRQLSQPEGFARAVVPASGVAKALKVILVIGVILFVYNLISTFQAINEYDTGMERFGEVYFTTTGRNFETDPRLVLQVWGPIVLVPIALILLVIELLTRRGRYEAAYQAFAQGGYTAKAFGLPFRFAVNRAMFVPQVIVPPQMGTPEVSQWLAGLAQTVSTLDKAGNKALTKTLISKLAKPEVAVPAESVFPGAPPFALLVQAPDALGAETVRAVVPDPRRTRAYLVDLKKVQGWG